MLKIENAETFGWETAIRGMRNPMNSWKKSDSYDGCWEKIRLNYFKTLFTNKVISNADTLI